MFPRACKQGHPVINDITVTLILLKRLTRHFHVSMPTSSLENIYFCYTVPLKAPVNVLKNGWGHESLQYDTVGILTQCSMILQEY